MIVDPAWPQGLVALALQPAQLQLNLGPHWTWAGLLWEPRIGASAGADLAWSRGYTTNGVAVLPSLGLVSSVRISTQPGVFVELGLRLPLLLHELACFGIICCLLLSSCVVQSQIASMKTDAGSSDVVDVNALLFAEIGNADPVDILFVIDNSGSLVEEHQRLISAIFSSSDQASTCNAAGYAQLREFLKEHTDLPFNEWPQVYQDILKTCGMVELLQVMGVDYHLALISTDINDCDRPGVSATRGSVPQRDCLQSSLAEPELTVVDSLDPQPQQHFQAILENVGVYGSAYEQNFAAARRFLDGVDESPPAGTCALSRDCSQDYAHFLRRQARNPRGELRPVRLLIIYLSDEDDCSNAGAIDETVPGNTSLCYEQRDLLTPINVYGEFFSQLKADPKLVSMMFIGGFAEVDGKLQAAGCKSLGQEISTACDPAQGNSVATCSMCVNGEPICGCHPEIQAEDCQGAYQAPSNCCEADPAFRFAALARQISQSSVGSICASDYREILFTALAKSMSLLPGD